MTGEADQEIVFVHNPGAVNQTQSFVALLGTDGKTISGKPDDVVFPTAANGTFYVADTGANACMRSPPLVSLQDRSTSMSAMNLAS